MKKSYAELKETLPFIDWDGKAPLIKKINELKKTRNAVVLCHNYQTPDIYYGVADIVGDSLKLAQEGAKTNAEVIVMAGVHFMAETAKIMSPEKTVLIPDITAGCSLAESITAQDVRDLKEKYPGIPVVTYVNTSADVKAECDITCTSGNAVTIVESLMTKKVIVVPDEYLAQWIASQTNVEIITWQGHCEVHKEFTGKEIRAWRDVHDGIKVIAHPECSQEVLAEADFVGSTAKMSNYVRDNQPEKVLLVTECSMSDNVAGENPNVEFVRPCNLCPHMKKITLEGIYNSLITMSAEIKIDSQIAARAKKAVGRMLVIPSDLPRFLW